MPAIKFLFHIAAPREKVYAAISTIEGLSNWWTKEVKGESKARGVIEFRFDSGGHDAKVLELKPNELVKWENLSGYGGWAGTIITFQLDDNEGKTRIRFTQDGWKEDGDMFANCAFSWSRYMWSLRQLCQTGKGEAYGSDNYRK